MSLRTSREGFGGLGLQAKQRPAVCRRIPRSPPRRLPSNLQYFNPRTELADLSELLFIRSCQRLKKEVPEWGSSRFRRSSAQNL
jgi:hypothetical protein